MRGVTTDTALRLSRYFRLSGRFWPNLQTRYDIEVENDRLAGRLDIEVSPLPPPRGGVRAFGGGRGATEHVNGVEPS